jgi:hypothetical protein
MKATELRIGNWLMGNAPFEVTGSNIALAQVREIALDTIHWQPIPLTEEWLVKMGFSDGLLQEESFNMKVNSKMWVSITDLDHEGLIHTHIEHVHQLQNLYHALTGQELELKSVSLNKLNDND